MTLKALCRAETNQLALLIYNFTIYKYKIDRKCLNNFKNISDV